jgi:phospholipid/cholesterol/gamma-HCH transport system ATP-binding protein
LFDSLSVWENVAFPLRERENLDEEEIGRRVDRLLEMVGAIHIRDLLPSEVSTGLKRSVAIARALAANPEAVLYDDEPTTMVDPIMAPARRSDSHTQNATQADQPGGHA